MVVGVAGAVGPGLDEKLMELLGDLPEGGGGAPEPAAESPNETRVKLHTKQSDQAHICIGFRTYEIGHPDRYVVELLRAVLGGGMSSRLFTEVRERRGLAYYVFAVIQGYADTGSLFTQAGVDIKRIDEAVSTIVGELKKIAEEPVPAIELEKARSYTKGRFVLSLESPQGMNRFGLLREVLENAHPDPSEVLSGLGAVTAEDVQRVAQDLITDDALRLASSARSTTPTASRSCCPDRAHRPPPPLPPPTLRAPAPYEVSFGRRRRDGAAGHEAARRPGRRQESSRRTTCVGDGSTCSVPLPRRDVTVRVTATTLADAGAAPRSSHVFGLPAARPAARDASRTSTARWRGESSRSSAPSPARAPSTSGTSRPARARPGTPARTSRPGRR